MRRDKMVIVGCGHWGRNYVRVFAGLLGADKISVVDSNVKALESIRQQHSGVGTSPSLSAALDSGGFGMAVIATPATTHFKLVKQCLAADLDVLAEKPLTLNVAEAAKLVQQAHGAKRILMVGHTFLYNPAVHKMRELIQEGVCGNIYYMKATRTHLGLIRTDVNAVWDLAPHDVSIFSYLLGKQPVSVSAVGGCYLKKETEDVAFINLTYAPNILASIHVSWADSNKERTISVVGSRARLLFDDLNALERVKIFEKGIGTNVGGRDSFGEFLFALRDGDIISPKIPTTEPLSAVCSEFLQCVKTRKEPLANARNGLDTVRVMCAIDRSLKHRGRPVPVK
ncbi:MAG: Gfo/Idh/MocA family oxidoreductase [bacterium]